MIATFYDKFNITLQIKQKALELGFDAYGVASLEPFHSHSEILTQWLSKEYNAQMKYLEQNFEKRINPKLLFDNAKSAIVVLLNYKPENELLFDNKFKVAKYAYGNDYHYVIKEKLNFLLSEIKKEIEVEGIAYTDTAPLLERALAERAGLGWIGKNSMLINQQLGSFTFIGILLVNIELEYNNIAVKNYCGSCNKCVDSCPTSAILPNKTIDANKCISYQTIESKEAELPANLNRTEYIFGCDICNDACPWNNKSPFTKEKLFAPIIQNLISDIENLTSSAFNRKYKKSALSRAGYKNIKRNTHSIQNSL